MRAWIDVAVLAKTRNLNGRFVVKSTAGLPFLLEPGDEVSFVPPQLDVPRSAFVEEVSLIDERSAEVAFEDVDGAVAGELVGCHCLIQRESLEEGDYVDAPGLWEGWKVIDDQLGMIGEVAGIIDNPGQALLQVNRADGRGIVLVPAVDAIVIAVDDVERTVRVSLPQGLMDL